MKIGILTQPLMRNYGGILQAYALQRVLQQMGHDVWLVQRWRNNHSFYMWCRTHISNFIKTFLGREKVRFESRAEENYKYSETKRFVQQYIVPKTEFIYSSKATYKDYLKRHYDAYVVGSDQVWRPCYSPCQEDFFLNFLPSQATVRRIAYAASFGTDEWEYSANLENKCARLLARFDGVSVRERGGISLCKTYLKREDVLHVLDPTLLLDRKDYEKLVVDSDTPKSKGNLFYYVLDNSSQLSHLQQEVAVGLQAVPFSVLPDTQDDKLPSPLQWLRAFMDADYVLTDSFHGTVFSIIFNRPFVVIGNESRGQARFHSLLSLFGLEDRLITSLQSNEIVNKMSNPIDWDKVHIVLNKQRTVSINYLNINLS